MIFQGSCRGAVIFQSPGSGAVVFQSPGLWGGGFPGLLFSRVVGRWFSRVVVFQGRGAVIFQGRGFPGSWVCKFLGSRVKGVLGEMCLCVPCVHVYACVRLCVRD